MKNVFILGLLALSLSGCATALTHEATRITQVDQNQKSQVQNCKSMGEVVGTSSYGGLFMQEAGKNYAKNQAMNEAANMRATHIVWTTAEGGFFGGKAYGVAYNCSKVAAN
ncbi:MAG: hypothetical protein V4654_06060 [Bdellovibrionota bacterium]